MNRGKEAGFVLIAALWFVALLAFIGVIICVVTFYFALAASSGALPEAWQEFTAFPEHPHHF